ncbi:hypothetical protein BD410DRAFT_781186 [Rickenella mellea]|uniref:Uncharacterized protein n=1 Tax=Rickenella mellea TaxID=50990 RepID=A0A4Y7QMP3_9AGAM|nr:hypothetical protein BD410DRAFT_781186 [Rickenella mellea]
MLTADNSHPHSDLEAVPNDSQTLVDELENAISAVSLQPHNVADAHPTANDGNTERPNRRLIVYTRRQALRLSQSPLVKPPDGMPPLKDWFGESNEHNLVANKRDADPSGSPVNPRERRYRRENDDGDSSSRSFRNTLTQPSQMGNFKHQSIRGSERDRDRERDAERDLRTLSDKYDRERGRVDRLGLPANSTLIRNRDREPAPHLPTGTTNRAASAQSTESVGSPSVRRDTTAKKRNGESSEDWRRGAEPPRSERDYSRRERDEQGRPRSRVRDGSRQRASPPLSRRERERDDTRKDRERDRERFGDADEDPRRWRDDGKRDERVTQRREKERKDKGGRAERDNDSGRTGEKGVEKDVEGGRDRDGWTVEERDSRGGKRSQRDRRRDGGPDEKDDRKEREKEKEPAWMETYVPPSTNGGILGGILGGQGADGEVDSIQAWKKDMKRREMKGKPEAGESPKDTVSDDRPSDSSSQPLDEIQLFKLMMKREEHKRHVHPDESTDDQGLLHASSTPESANISSTTIKATENESVSTSRSIPGLIDAPNAISTSPPHDNAPPTAPDSLLKLFATVEGSSFSPDGPPKPSNVDVGVRKTSRLFSKPLSEHNDPSVDGGQGISSPVAQFEPPRQSRLLALGSKVSPQIPQQAPSETFWSGSQMISAPMATQQNSHRQVKLPTGIPPPGNPDMLNRFGQGMYTKPSQQTMDGDGVHSMRAFPQVDHHMSSIQPTDAFPDGGHSSSIIDRLAYSSHVDSPQQVGDARVMSNSTPPTAGSLTQTVNHASTFDGQAGTTSANFAMGKGSRFAKFFDDKSKIGASALGDGRGQPAVGGAPSATTSPRQENPAFNTMPNMSTSGVSNGRNFGDILAMLNNSAQRSHQGNVHPAAMNGLNHGASNITSVHHHQLQQQQQQQQNILHNQLAQASSNLRHDPMFDVDDGRFSADGMVPGLRPGPVPAPRSRESSGGTIFHGQFDETIQFNPARLPPQQRNVDQLYSNPIPVQFSQQGIGAGRGGVPQFQQVPFRGGPSPTGNFNPHQSAQHRLPPGLANLGARPPHEPSQYIGLGMNSQVIHGGLQSNNVPPPYPQFQGNGQGFAGNPQPSLRGPPVGLTHLANPQSSALNGANTSGVEYRGQPAPLHASLVGGNGPTRGGTVYNPHQGLGSVQGAPVVGIRQQQNLPQHMMQQMLPPQMQPPHGFAGTQHNQSDLMALLMGGASHRE